MISKWYFAEDLPTWALFVELAVAGMVVILAGTRFAKVADRLADKLNLGGGWIGLILLATVTSLPEVVAGGTATAIGNSGMAMASLFGSCSFNVTIIVLMNALIGGGSVLRGVSPSHALTSSFGLLLIGLGLLGVVLGDKFQERLFVAQVCEIGWSLAIVVTYFGCMRLVYQFERRSDTAGASASAGGFGAAGYLQIGVIAVVIVVAAWWLAQIGDTLSTHEIKAIGRPLGATFVGAVFLALATSLPEISTSIAAVRLGNLDMALGNIFGSNMFNIFVIPMLKSISLINGEALLMGRGTFDAPQNEVTGLIAILLTAIAVGGLAYKSQHKMWRRFGFDSVLIATVYIGGMVLLIMEAK